jgi:hypothetical protein
VNHEALTSQNGSNDNSSKHLVEPEDRAIKRTRHAVDSKGQDKTRLDMLIRAAGAEK